MIVLTGASGMLGTDLLLHWSNQGTDVVAVTHTHPVKGARRAIGLNLEDEGAVRRVLDELRPQWVVHCAALTDVDACERDRERAVSINAGLAQSVARAAALSGVRMLHISTDSVFDGTVGDYRESDEVSPINEYARSKVLAERAVLASGAQAVVLRTNIFGWGREEKGLARWIVGKLQAGATVPGFVDCHFNPLFTASLGILIDRIFDANLEGIFHAGCADPMSKFEFAQRVASLLGFDPSRVVPVSMDSVAWTARRPKNTTLCTQKLAATLGIEMPRSDQGLQAFRELAQKQNFEPMNANCRSLV